MVRQDSVEGVMKRAYHLENTAVIMTMIAVFVHLDMHGAVIIAIRQLAPVVLVHPDIIGQTVEEHHLDHVRPVLPVHQENTDLAVQVPHQDPVHLVSLVRRAPSIGRAAPVSILDHANLVLQEVQYRMV